MNPNLTRLAPLAMAALLPFLPLARTLSAHPALANSAFAVVLKWLAAGVVLGSYHAVSGATTEINSPTTARGTNGVQFVYQGTTVGQHLPNLWMANPLPAGLSMDAPSGFITGFPRVPGVTITRLVGTNTGGADRVVSQNVTITIFSGTGPPKFALQPRTTNGTPGQPAGFEVAVAGATPITYFWRLNGTNPIATGPDWFLKFPAAMPAQSGLYSVVASNTAGTATSATAGLTFSSTLVATGSVWKYLDDGSFPGTAWRSNRFNDTTWLAGRAPLGYGESLLGTFVRSNRANGTRIATHYFRNELVLDTTNDLFGLQLRLRRDDGGAVYLNGREVFRSNLPGTALASNTLASAAVTGTSETTFFTTNPPVSALVTGTNVIAVEIHQVSLTTTGTNSDLGFDLSLTGQRVFAPPRIVSPPEDHITTNGDTVTFSVAAAGPAPLGYQWSFNGEPLAGQTAPVLTLADVTVDHAGSYRVLVTNAAGQATSPDAQLSVLLPPRILVAPENQTVDSGANAIFTVVAEGTDPLAFQWFHDGQPIAGAIGPILTLTAVTTNDAGFYSVRVENLVSTAESEPVALTVNPPTTTPAAPQLTLLTGTPGFAFLAKPGFGYVVEASTNLTAGLWLPAATYPASPGPTTNVFDFLLDVPLRFYRVRVGP